MTRFISQRADLTFKDNQAKGRHGWLRLTPAYSLKVVQTVLNRADQPGLVLDPFSGTGTTGLVCAERGLACDLVELNPFLAWFAGVKTYSYTPSDLQATLDCAHTAARSAREISEHHDLWIPPINFIERWWSRERLIALARLFNELHAMKACVGESPAYQLLLVAFCRVAIDWSNAAFNHQSMSFKTSQPTLFVQQESDQIIDSFLWQVREVVKSAALPILGPVTVINGDSRHLPDLVSGTYDCVITSPPYPNRISYIREVRPYMYWLGYLGEAREAGDLDWQAIGGTWGIATSRLAQWEPKGASVYYDGFETIIQKIGRHSLLLANYVYKYFVDMTTHLNGLKRILAPGASVYYIVGNSKFYDTVVPVEEIYRDILYSLGFKNVGIEVLRKRNSKKELLEFIVSAQGPGSSEGST